MYLSPEQRALVLETGSLYRRVCNEVSVYVLESGCMSFYDLNASLYHRLRAEYGIRSQMTQSVFRTVLAAVQFATSTRRQTD